MTRAFEGRVACPSCGHIHTAETAFERWMRNHPSLDSRSAGIVRFDCDLMLHQYKRVFDKKSSRDVQCLMFIEIKTFGANLSEAQRDTFYTLDQVLRNRRGNMHQANPVRHQADEHVPLAKVRSYILKSEVRLRMFGVHVLRLSDADPESSAWMQWDKRAITNDQLLQLLRFEIDPDTLRPMDWRRRSAAWDKRLPPLVKVIQSAEVA